MGLALSLRKPLIFLWRDLVEKASYRMAFGLGLAGMVLWVAIFYYLGELVQFSNNPHLLRYGGDYFSFALIGLAFSRYLGTAMATFSSTIRSGQMMGTLEALLATPTRLSTILVASSLWPFLATTISVFFYLMIGALFFGADLGKANVVAAIAVLALTVVAFSGLGILSAAFTMAFKRGDPINFVIHSVSVLIGGVYYPVTVLPDSLQTVSEWLPITHALRGMRLAVLQGSGISELAWDLATLALFSLVFLPVGVFAFDSAVRQAKKGWNAGPLLMSSSCEQVESLSSDQATIIEAFIGAYERNARIGRLRFRQLDAILTEFQSAGVEVLPLKGADLVGRAYGGLPGLRPMVDVDLLFHRQDLPRIHGILEGRGFRRLPAGNPCYVSPDQLLTLDMFSDIWYRTDVEANWRRSVLRPVAGRLRPAMHPEDAFIYLLAYQTIHRGRLEPQFAVDAAALIDAEEDLIDWNNVVRELVACHLDLPAYHGLVYACREGGAKVPSSVLEALRSKSARLRWIGGVYQCLVGEQDILQLGYVLLVLSRPGLQKKIKGLWEMLFPSREFLYLRYQERSWFGLLSIRMTRPVSLAFGGARLFLRIGYRLIGWRRFGLPL